MNKAPDLYKEYCVFSGYRRVWHSGGLISYITLVWIFPDVQTGNIMIVAVVVFPRQQNPLPECVDNSNGNVQKLTLGLKLRNTVFSFVR